MIAHSLISWLAILKINRVEIIGAAQIKLPLINSNSNTFLIPIDNSNIHELEYNSQYLFLDKSNFALDDSLISSLINFLFVAQIKSAMILIRGFSIFNNFYIIIIYFRIYRS